MLTGKKLCKWNAEKRRTVMPSELKESLVGEGYGEKLVVVKSMYEKCLYVYSEAEWQSHVEKLRNIPQKTRDKIWALRHYVGGAVKCDIDVQGRFVLPKDEVFQATGEDGLLEYAGLLDVEEVIIQGNINHAEIWSKANMEAYDQEARERAGAPSNEDVMKAFSDELLEYMF